jgi:hypothetical protein
LDEKARICREQINHWQGMLMKVEESRSSNSLSKSSSKVATSHVEKSGVYIEASTNDAFVGDKVIEYEGGIDTFSNDPV